MTNNFDDVFDNWGIKKVTKTDKNRSAYVPNAQQVKAILSAGITPSPNRPADPFMIRVINNPVNEIKTSYYHSERSDEAGREPEPRMGREFISKWLSLGETVLVGNIGNDLFACKVDDDENMPSEIENEIAVTASDTVVFARAKSASRMPERRRIEREEYARDPFIVQAALRRAGGVCEMPGCGSAPFLKDNGDVFLEVHHIRPLSDRGDDSLENVAALCPNCHRELHHGASRIRKSDELKTAISKKSS